MLQSGLIAEVEALIAQGIKANPSAATAIGYRETIAFLEGALKREELLPAIVQNTLHLVKKQGTWFRTQIRKPDELVVF
jgi:tRNA dimethylallyltransferase